ncbi:hypothetical protein BH24ACT5_BH24ACT5_14750 [soil metagenome]
MTNLNRNPNPDDNGDPDQAPLPPDAVESFRRDGYAIFRPVVDAGTITDVNGHVDWLLERHPDRRPEDLGHDLARTDPFWIDLVGHPGLLDIAQLFVGPDIALFATHYICKAPRTGRAVHWHQDGAFWPLEPMNVVSLWLAVTRSDRSNGGLRVVPGSHTNELAPMHTRDDGAAFDQEISVDVDERAAVDVELEPGDVSVHHPRIHHCSDANTSTRWRRGLTIRYIPTSTRITDPERACPFLLRGSDLPAVNCYLPHPAATEATYQPGRTR